MKIFSKNKKERVAVYIDGSNFYGYLKDKEIDFPKGIKFDFNAFVKFLVGDRTCVSKRYYTGVFRNLDNSDKSIELVRGQQKFFSEIELEYVGFSHNPSLGMQKYADLSILLTPKDINNFKEKTLL